MILVILVGLVLLFSWLMVFVKSGRKRTIGIIVSLVALSAVILACMANDYYQWGMQTRSQTTTIRLQRLAPREGLRVTWLGTGQERRVRYRISNGHVLTTPAKSTAQITIKVGTPAQLTTVTQRLAYQNGLSRWLFSWGRAKQTVVSQHYLFQVPSSWNQQR